MIYISVYQIIKGHIEGNTEWGKQLDSCIKKPETLEKLNSLREVAEVGSKHGLPEYPAAILYHSQ